MILDQFGEKLLQSFNRLSRVQNYSSLVTGVGRQFVTELDAGLTIDKTKYCFKPTSEIYSVTLFSPHQYLRERCLLFWK